MMKKIILTTLAFYTLGSFCAQSHEAGDLVFDLNYEINFGLNENGEFDGEDFNYDEIEGRTVNAGGLRFDAQYGFTDLVSAGFFTRFGTQVAKFDDINIGQQELKRNYSEAGVELRVHAVNVDNFNIYIAPSIGIASAKDRASDDPEDSNEYKYSGMTYGLGAGFNFFFTENIGANLRVGYGGRAYTSDQDSFDGLSTVEVKYGLVGLDAGAGILVKF